MGFIGIGLESVSKTPVISNNGFAGIGMELVSKTPTIINDGFAGAGLASALIFIQSVVIVDLIGNVNTFAITNASLEDITGVIPSVSLSFIPNVWTALENNFYFGVNQANIRVNFDIAGVSFSANPFNITEVEQIPTINILP